MGVPQRRYYTTYFAPDIDQWWNVNPGVLSDIADLVPTKRSSYESYQAASSDDLGNGAFSEATYGTVLSGQILKRVDGSGRMLAATTKRLLENTGLAWVDVSAGGVDYTTATGWSFAAFGNDVIAVSKTNAAQVSNVVAGAFAALGGSPPKASCVTVQKNFVVMADTDDGVNNLGDNIMWSALGNDASWAASAATQAGNLRILDAPGKITALVNMRDAIAVYKEDSLHILDYRGSPFLWTSRLVSDKVGCASPQGVAVVNGIHYFLHRTGVHRFDGASVINIGAPVYQYLVGRMGSQANYATVQAVHDEHDNLILFYFHDAYTADGGGAAANERRYALVYHPDVNLYGFIKHAWNAASGTCRCALRATLSDLTAWRSDQANGISNIITLGNESGVSITTRRSVFGRQANSSSSITTGFIGDNVTIAKETLQEFTLRVDNLLAMSNATVTNRRFQSGTIVDDSVTFTPNTTTGTYDGVMSASGFTIAVPLTGIAEINGMYVVTAKSGMK